MFAHVKRHITSHAVGYLALLVATSGTAYAAGITGADVVDDSLTGRDVKESSLERVPSSLLAGRRVKYQVQRASTGVYSPVTIVDFKGLQVRVNCANQFAFITVEVRSTLPRGTLDYAVVRGDIGAGWTLGEVAQGGQQMQEGVWVPIAPESDNQRGMYDVMLSFPDHLVTAHLVARLVSGGGFTCSVDGVVGGV